jgi:hypothetical protein
LSIGGGFLFRIRHGKNLRAGEKQVFSRGQVQPASCRCDTLRAFLSVNYEGIQSERRKMEEQRPAQPGQVQIKADEKELQGSYSNLVMIHHNVEEFTLNFIYIFPNGNQGKLLQSMIVSPGHAKRIWRALGENLTRYESQFGPIKEAPESGPTPNVGFVQ